MATKRAQARDHLGRFARASRGPVRRALASAGRLALAALRADLARRFYRLGVAAVVLAATVVLLYQFGEGPELERGAKPAAAAVTTAHAAPARAGAAAPSGRSGTGGNAVTAGDASARPKAPAPAAPAKGGRAATPAAVAAAWYAHREGVDASLVRPLQQDRVSSREVRVLVLADRGRGRIDTALVTVRRDAAGGWAVR